MVNSCNRIQVSMRVIDFLQQVDLALKYKSYFTVFDT